MASASSTAQTAATANANARAALNGALSGVQAPVRAFQPVSGAPQVLANPPLGLSPVVFNVVPRAVGVLRRMLVKVTLTVSVPAGTTLSRSPFGPACLLSRIVLTDLNNLTRHDTTGYHMAMLASIRNRQPAGSAYLTDTPLGFGNTFGGGIVYPTVASSGAAQTIKVQMIYEVPVAYMDGDYRGAIFLGTLQAQVNLALTLNPNMFVLAGADPTEAAYVYSGTAPTVTNVIVAGTQDYLDGIPKDASGSYMLPWLDMATMYQCLRQDQGGVVAGQQNQWAFANFRTYQSVFAIYNNGGTLYPGTDLNTWSMASANLYNYFTVDSDLQSYRTRNAIGDDVPAGTYYFSFRDRPINTTDYGNTYLQINPTLANANAKLTMLSEYFSTQQTLTTGSVS